MINKLSEIIFTYLCFSLRAEAIKGILSRKSAASAAGSTSITHGVKDLSLSSNSEPTPVGNSGDKRPHLTAKELDVLKYESSMLLSLTVHD